MAKYAVFFIVILTSPFFIAGFLFACCARAWQIGAGCLDELTENARD